MTCPRIFLAVIFVTLATAGCGGKDVKKDRPTRATVNPEKELQDNYASAYFQISCMANEGVDPLMTMTPLRKPDDYIAGLVEAKSTRMEAVQRVLEDNGFISLKMFTMAGNRLKANRDYWRTIDERFVDELLKCK